MWLDLLSGMFERRVLVCYRVDPDALGRILPEPLQPRLVLGHAVVGVCVSRWASGTEEALHRAAVVLPGGDAGVRVLKRTSDWWFSPRARRIQFKDSPAAVSVRVRGGRSSGHIELKAWASGRFPSTSVFSSVREAASFFGDPPVYVEALRVEKVRVRLFEEPGLFPEGAAEFDCALVLRREAPERGTSAEWAEGLRPEGVPVC